MSSAAEQGKLLIGSMSWIICSTYDGIAIAYATLSHIAEIGCNTLFVTHYPTVAQDLAREKPDKISNWHMSFDEIKMPGMDQPCPVK